MVDRDTDTQRSERLPGRTVSGDEDSSRERERREIDVTQLAERVYRLMRDDLRLERARRGLN
jgi:hypothetical protein